MATCLEVAVTDDGPASGDRVRAAATEGSASAGLRGRVESLGGEFDFRPGHGQGTRLTARFILAKVETFDA